MDGGIHSSPSDASDVPAIFPNKTAIGLFRTYILLWLSVLAVLFSLSPSPSSAEVELWSS